MEKYHISKDGKVRRCHAKQGNCPLGGEEQHFKTREEAEEVVSKKMENKYGLLSGVEEVAPLFSIELGLQYCESGSKKSALSYVEENEDFKNYSKEEKESLAKKMSQVYWANNPTANISKIPKDVEQVIIEGEGAVEAAKIYTKYKRNPYLADEAKEVRNKINEGSWVSNKDREKLSEYLRYIVHKNNLDLPDFRNEKVVVIGIDGDKMTNYKDYSKTMNYNSFVESWDGKTPQEVYEKHGIIISKFSEDFYNRVFTGLKDGAEQIKENKHKPVDSWTKYPRNIAVQGEDGAIYTYVMELGQGKTTSFSGRQFKVQFRGNPEWLKIKDLWFNEAYTGKRAENLVKQGCVLTKIEQV